jgi:hypothetical protein
MASVLTISKNKVRQKEIKRRRVGCAICIGFTYPIFSAAEGQRFALERHTSVTGNSQWSLITPGAFDDHIIHRSAGIGALVPDPIAFIIGNPVNDHFDLAVVVIEIIGGVGRSHLFAVTPIPPSVPVLIASVLMAGSTFLFNLGALLLGAFRGRGSGYWGLRAG